MASTTALLYRYHKKGIEVNLSPQNAFSCYIRDCINGNNIIDSLLNLIKNGSVTEECFPYSSNKGKIEDCPLKCQEGSELEINYAKNAYIINNPNYNY